MIGLPSVADSPSDCTENGSRRPVPEPMDQRLKPARLTRPPEPPALAVRGGASLVGTGETLLTRQCGLVDLACSRLPLIVTSSVRRAASRLAECQRSRSQWRFCLAGKLEADPRPHDVAVARHKAGRHSNARLRGRLLPTVIKRSDTVSQSHRAPAQPDAEPDRRCPAQDTRPTDVAWFPAFTS